MLMVNQHISLQSEATQQSYEKGQRKDLDEFHTCFHHLYRDTFIYPLDKVVTNTIDEDPRQHHNTQPH